MAAKAGLKTELEILTALDSKSAGKIKYYMRVGPTTLAGRGKPTFVWYSAPTIWHVAPHGKTRRNGNVQIVPPCILTRNYTPPHPDDAF